MAILPNLYVDWTEDVGKCENEYTLGRALTETSQTSLTHQSEWNISLRPFLSTKKKKNTHLVQHWALNA